MGELRRKARCSLRSPNAAMTDSRSSWAVRLAQRRAETFVGRETERRILRTILSQTDLSFQVFALIGPPGSGKTTLLRLFGTECDAAGVPYTFIDARAIQPSADSLLRVLRAALYLSESESIPDALASHKRFVLMMDNYDVLYGLHDWLCEVFFPQLPASVAVLISSRRPLPELWRTDPAWRELVKVMELSNLSVDEARTYLHRRAVPPDHHARVIAFSRGHPLALSLAADLYAQRLHAEFDPSTEPGLTQTLVRRFTGDLYDPSLRDALEASAVVRITTESVLAALLAKPDVRTEFDWLCGLSFIDFYSVGIYPHDLVREVLLYDLNWRNPDRLAQLRRRALQYYTERLKRSSHPSDEELIEDYLFLHRDHAVFSPFLRQRGAQAILPMCEPATPADHRQMIALVRRWEGDESARHLSHWLRVQPGGAQVIRDEYGNVAAFMFIARLDGTGNTDITADPVVQAIWEHLQRQNIPTPDGVVTVMRFVVHAQRHQELSPEIGAFAVALLQHCLAVRNLEFTFTVLVHPERWESLAASTGFFPRVTDLYFEVSGLPVGVFMQDWRTEPPGVWLTRLAALQGLEGVPDTQSDADATLRSTEAIMTSAKDMRLRRKQEADPEREQFGQDVRQALKHFHVWDVLASNRLVDSKIVHKAAGPDADISRRVQALQETLRSAVEFLGTMPTRERLYRALRYTYLEPQGSQEQTAEFLNLPFSTYRGHLRAGINALADLLWHQEADL